MTPTNNIRLTYLVCTYDTLHTAVTNYTDLILLFTCPETAPPNCCCTFRSVPTTDVRLSAPTAAANAGAVPIAPTATYVCVRWLHAEVKAARLSVPKIPKAVLLLDNTNNQYNDQTTWRGGDFFSLLVPLRCPQRKRVV